jgi:hypothetical protein
MEIVMPNASIRELNQADCCASQPHRHCPSWNSFSFYGTGVTPPKSSSISNGIHKE